MGVEKTVPRKAINKSTKTRLVFDEKKRKDFLTGFRRRKDERRQKWKDKVDNDLKKEVQKIKEQTRAKIQKSKGNKSNEIVPEIAHLIENNKGSSTTTQMDTASVTVTTFDNLSELAAPWRKEETEENEQEEDSTEEEEEVPGMSMKSATVEKVVIGTKEKKAINKAAVRELQKTKAFKAKEKMRAKKQRSESKFKEKKKTLSKKDKHKRKIKGKEKVG